MTSLTIPKDGIYYVTMELGAACTPQMTIDGSNYYDLDGGSNLAAGWNTLSIPLRSGDTFNLKQASGNTVAVNVLRIDF